MRKFLLLMSLLACLALAAPAQTYPRWELFAGYSYGNVDSNVSGQSGPRTHANGWAGSVAGNLHQNLGFTADVAGHYGSLRTQRPAGNLDLDYRDYQFMFGPQLSHRMEYSTVFAHALFGGVNTRISGGTFTLPGPPVTTLTIPRTDVTHFGMGFGGGLDVHAGKHVAVRFGFDWVPVLTKAQDWQQNFRANVGVVFKSGS